MTKLSSLVLGIAVTAAVLVPGSAADAASPARWRPPQCGTVDGDGSISFTRNAGRTITPTAARQKPVKYLRSLVTLAAPNTLLAVDNRGGMYMSFDAGCGWDMWYPGITADVAALTASPDGSAYVWDRNSTLLYRVVGREVTARPDVPARDDPRVVALEVDRFRPRHLRAVLGDGTVVDSYDAGGSFRVTGAALPPGTFLYTAAIDPWNLDHVVAGTMSSGGYASWTGGRTWSRSSLADGTNVFSVVVSPANPLVVWAQGLNLAENTAGAPSEGRHIYRSTDGGRTFRAVVDHVPGRVTLVNGALLAADPNDPAVLYFVFGTYFANYGTDLFTFDARGNRLTVHHNDHDRITAIAFHPTACDVMYLGFAEER